MPQAGITTAGAEFQTGYRNPEKRNSIWGKRPGSSTKPFRNFREYIEDIDTTIKDSSGKKIINKQLIIKLQDTSNHPAFIEGIKTAELLTKESYHYCGSDSQTVDVLKMWTDSNWTIEANRNGIIDILERQARILNNILEGSEVASAFAALSSKTNEMSIADSDLIVTYNLANNSLDTAKIKLKAKIEILKKILLDANSNQNFLNSANSNSNINGNNSLNLNTKFNNYLTDRITNTADTTISNYKELYDNIELQNKILEKTVKKMDDNLLENNRKSNFESKNKDSIYIIYLRLMIGYFILLFIFCIKLIFFTKDMMIYKIMIIIIFLVVFPFMLPRIEIYVYNTLMFIRSIMTGTVYHS